MANNKNKFLKKFLTTASALAVIAGGAESAMGAAGDGFSRIAIANPDFGANLKFYNNNNGSAGAAVAFADGNNFIYSRESSAKIQDLKMTGMAKNINSFNVYGHDGHKLTIGVTGGKLGSVYNRIDGVAKAEVDGIGGNNSAAGVSADAKLKLVLGAGGDAFTTTLTGTGGAVGGGAGFPPVDDYSALGEIDFGAGANILKIDANSGNEISFDATTTASNAANANSALDVDTDLKVKHASFAGISKLDIAAGKKLTFDVADNVTTTANSVITFGDAASAVIFDIDNSANSKTITLGADISGGGAAKGTIEFISGAAGKDLTIVAGGARSIGTDNGANRIATLKIGGAGNVIFDANTTVRAIDIVQNNTGTTTYTTEVDSGANSTMKFGAVGTVKFLEGIKNAAIDFNNQGATIELSDGKTITGAVDNKAGAGDTGTLKFIGAGKVTDVIGATKTLKLIDAYGAGDVELDAAVSATTLRVGNAGTVVKAADVVTANVDFAAAGEYQASKVGANAIVGDVNFNGHDGTLKVADTADINGAINNDQSAVITVATVVALAQDAKGAVLLTNAEVQAAIATLGAGANIAPAKAAAAASVALNGNGVLADAIAAINGNSLVVVEALTVGGGTNAKDAVVAFGNKAFGNVIFAGASTVTGALGAGKPLELVEIAGKIGGKTVAFNSALKAVELKLSGKDHASITQNSVIDKLTLVGDAASEVKIANGMALEFTGNENVTLQLDAGQITFDGNDSTLKFNAADGNQRTVNIAGADLDSGANGKGKIILKSDGDNGGVMKSKLTIQGGNKLGNANAFKFIQVEGDAITEIQTPIKTALLDIKQGATLITTDASAALVASTKIGEAVGESTLVYAGAGNIDINTIGATDVKFLHADSLLKLEATAGAGRTFELKNDVDPGANNGIVELHSNNAGSEVTLTTVAGGKTLGVGARKLKELRATGDKTSIVTNLVDITNVDKLSVKQGSTLDVKTHTAGAIADISIGEAGGGGTLVLDTNDQVNVDLLNGGAIAFEHADSVLKLTNVGGGGVAADGVFTLHANLAPGAATDLQGSLELHAGAAKLDIAANAAETIGTDNAHRLKELKISGDKSSTIGNKVYAHQITIASIIGAGDKIKFTKIIDTGGVDGGAVKSNITFTQDTNLVEFDEAVTTQKLDFAGHTTAVKVTADKVLSVESIVNGNKATLSFENAGELVLAAPATVSLKGLEVAKVGTTKLGAGQYTVEKLKLVAANALELTDGFELTGAINKGEGLAAAIQFKGDGKVTGVMGSTAANKVGAVTVEGNSTLQLGGTVHAISIDGNVANDQNLKFINAGDIEVHGTVGGGAAFTNIEFTTANKVDFKNALTNPTELVFSSGAEVITKGFDLGATKITKAANGKLTVDEDQTIIGDVSAFGTLHVTNDKTVTLNTANFGAKLTTHADNNGIVNLSNAALKVSDIGADGTGFKAVNVTENATADNIFATSINVNNGATADIKNAKATTIDVSAASTLTAGTGTVNDFHIKDTSKATIGAMTIGNELKFFGDDAEASFSTAGRDLNFSILGNAAGKGILNLTNGETISQDIGTTKLKEVNIDTSPVIVSANISANTINVKDTITLTKDATFTGASNFDDAKIELGDKDLTLKGNVVFTGDSKIETKLKSTTEVGNLVIATGSKVTLAAGDKLTINVDDAGVSPQNGKTIIIVKTEGNADLSAVARSSIEITKTNAFSAWRFDGNSDGLVLTQESQVREVLEQDLQSTNSEEVVSVDILQGFEDAQINTDADEARILIGKMQTKANRSDAIQRLFNTTSNEVSAVSFNNLTEVTTTVTNRIAEVAAPIFTIPQVTPTAPTTSSPTLSAPAPTGGVAAPAGTATPSNQNNTNQLERKVSSENDYISGVAAGDDHQRYGAWISPSYSYAKQKTRGSTSGFKAESYGGTFGFDTKTNDTTTLGVAFSALNTNIKHKDFKSGDKTTVNSFLASIYGVHQFAPNCFAQGVFSIGSSNVNNKENRRLSDTEFGLAESKYNSMNFSLETTAGYNHLVNNKFVITPMLGLGYSRINGGSYKESGSSDAVPLLQVSKRASQKLDVIAGVRVSAMPFVANDMEITPELHAFVRHDVIGKAAKVSAKLEGMDRTSEKPKLQKTFYSVGTSLNASYSMMDYGASVDAQFANKYVGVQGSLKMRVNF